MKEIWLLLFYILLLLNSYNCISQNDSVVNMAISDSFYIEYVCLDFFELLEIFDAEKEPIQLELLKKKNYYQAYEILPLDYSEHYHQIFNVLIPCRLDTVIRANRDVGVWRKVPKSIKGRREYFVTIDWFADPIPYEADLIDACQALLISQIMELATFHNSDTSNVPLQNAKLTKTSTYFYKKYKIFIWENYFNPGTCDSKISTTVAIYHKE